MATCMATSFSGDKQSFGRPDARPPTDLAIKNLKAGESRTDGALPVGNGRLVVSCTKARGQLRRVWTFRYRKEALRGELKVSEHPGLSLEHASFSVMLDAYVVYLVRSGKESAHFVAAIFKRHVSDPWPDLVKLPANRIAPEHIRHILARLVRKGIGRQTYVLRSYVQAAFTHGARSDLDPRRAAVGSAVYSSTNTPHG